MPELPIDKLQYKIIIPDVPMYSHAQMSFLAGSYHPRAADIFVSRTEEKYGTITIDVPLFYEGMIGIRLWRPTDPVPEDSAWKWADDKDNFADYTFHTDIFVDRQYVMSGHAFINCKKTKINEIEKVNNDIRGGLSKIQRRAFKRWGA